MDWRGEIINLKRGEDSRERPSTIIARTEAETPRELGTGRAGRKEKREKKEEGKEYSRDMRGREGKEGGNSRGEREKRKGKAGGRRRAKVNMRRGIAREERELDVEGKLENCNSVGKQTEEIHRRLDRHGDRREGTLKVP